MESISTLLLRLITWIENRLYKTSADSEMKLRGDPAQEIGIKAPLGRIRELSSLFVLLGGVHSEGVEFTYLQEGILIPNCTGIASTKYNPCYIMSE